MSRWIKLLSQLAWTAWYLKGFPSPSLLKRCRLLWPGAFAIEPTRDLARYVALLQRGPIQETGSLPDPDQVQKVLWVNLGHIGDLIHSMPALRALKTACPQAQVDLLVGPWGKGVAEQFADLFNELLIYTPHLRMCHRGQDGEAQDFAQEKVWMQQLKAAGYHVLVTASVTDFIEYVIVQAANPALWLGADREDLPAPPEGRALLQAYDGRAYEAQRLVDLVQGWIGGTPSADLFFPIADTAKAEQERLLQEHQVQGGYWVVAPGAGWPGKCWPADRFSACCNRFKEPVFLIGAKDEHALCESIAKECGDHVVNIAGATSLPGLAAVIDRARGFIGNDSGPMHIAAAVDTPSVTLFGPTPDSKWAPKGPRHRVVRKVDGVPGSWHWHPDAPAEKAIEAMRLIEVDEVLDALKGVAE